MGPATRLLFLSLEFSAGTFSGNGVYAQSQVRSLVRQSYEVFVVSAKPAAHKAEPQRQGARALFEVPVSRWGRLDASAPYEEFASAAEANAQLLAALQEFRPQVAMVVDWSALPAYRALLRCLQQSVNSPVPRLPLVYLNYRVFSRTSAGEELALVHRLETEAMQEAILTVALSRSDAEYLMEHMVVPARSAAHVPTAVPGQAEEGGATEPDGPLGGAFAPHAHGVCSAEGATACARQSRRPEEVKVVLPALRDDMHRLPLPPDMQRVARALGLPTPQLSIPQSAGGSDDSGSDGVMSTPVGDLTAAAKAFSQGRQYLTCCVRLSPEKEPHRFVELVEAMASSGKLHRLGLVPLMVGASSDDYAEGLKARLRAATPDAVVLEQFMGPQQLAELYSRTRLNVHPASYDAYGMTIVEAASQGAPSLVHDGNGAVGATDLLSSGRGEVVLADLNRGPQALAELVEALVLRTPSGASCSLISDATGTEDAGVSSSTAGSEAAGGVMHSAAWAPGGLSLAEVAARAAVKARSWDEAANARKVMALVHGAMAQSELSR